MSVVGHGRYCHARPTEARLQRSIVLFMIIFMILAGIQRQ
jgi:hypothetical protein